MKTKDTVLYFLAGLVLLVSLFVLLGSWYSGVDSSVMMASMLHGTAILLGAGVVGWLFKVSLPFLVNGAALLIWIVIRPVVENINGKYTVLLQQDNHYLNETTEALYQEPTWWMGESFFYLFIGGVVIIFIAFFFRR